MKKVNVIVMNPPYAMKDGEHENSASPLYNPFIDKAIDELRPDYLVSINPSRWMIGGKGLDKFRKKMLADKRIKIIIDDMSPSGIFPDVDIAGGVNYFLWHKDYNGLCSFNGFECDLNEYDVVLRENSSRSILKKVVNAATSWLGTEVSPRKPYGIEVDAPVAKEGVPCWFKRSIGLAFVDSSLVKNKNNINLWRVLAPKATSSGGSAALRNGRFFGQSSIIVAKPNEYCTETYLVLKAFQTQNEAKNFISYLNTKFFRFMLRLRVASQNLTRENYNWVPNLGDYSRPWTDEELYKMFDLNKQEQDYINGKIKEL